MIYSIFCGLLYLVIFPFILVSNVVAAISDSKSYNMFVVILKKNNSLSFKIFVLKRKLFGYLNYT